MRQALVACAFGLAAAATLVAAVFQWSDLASPLGYKDRLGKGDDLPLALSGADGLLVGYATPSTGFLWLEQDGRIVVDGIDADGYVAAVRAGQQPAGGRLTDGKGILDLATGRITKVPGGLEAEALSATLAWGTLDGQPRAERLDGSGGFALPPAPEGCGRFLSANDQVAVRDCGDAGQLVWADGRTRNVTATRLVQAFGRPAVLVLPDAIVVLAPGGGLVEWRDLATGDVVATQQVPPAGDTTIAFAAQGGRWALAKTGPGGDGIGPALNLAAGARGGTAEAYPAGTASILGLALVDVAPVEGGLAYLQEGDGWIAHPGEARFPPLPLAVAGVLLAGLAAAWVPLRMRRLGRTAGAGTKRCLHCGARRDPSLAFCPLCGWRTQDEAKAAAPKVDPWEKADR